MANHLNQTPKWDGIFNGVKVIKIFKNGKMLILPTRAIGIGHTRTSTGKKVGTFDKFKVIAP